MDPRHRGNTRDQKHGSKARILTDPQSFCLDHHKLTIKSHNKTTGMDYTTENSDPRPRGHTKEQKRGSEAQILTNPQCFCVGQPNVTAKSHN